MDKSEKKQTAYTVVIDDPFFDPTGGQRDSNGRYVRKFLSYGEAYRAMNKDFYGLLDWHQMDGQKEVSVIKDDGNDRIVLIDGVKISMKILKNRA